MFIVLHRIYSSEDPIVDLFGPFHTRTEAVKKSQERARKEFEDLDLSEEDGVCLVLADHRGIGITSQGDYEQHWEVRELHN